MPSAALTELHFPAHSSCHLRLHAEHPAGSAFVQAKRADVQPRLARGFPTLLWPRVLGLLLPRGKLSWLTPSYLGLNHARIQKRLLSQNV
jgi:hypothetical protein